MLFRSEANQHEDAVRLLSKAIEIDPKYRRAYELRAQSYEALGRKDLAEADNQRAQQLEQAEAN